MCAHITLLRSRYRTFVPLLPWLNNCCFLTFITVVLYKTVNCIKQKISGRKQITICFIYTFIYHFCCSSFLHIDLALHPALFPFSLKNSFNTSLLTMNLFSFLLSEKVFIYLHLKNM